MNYNLPVYECVLTANEPEKSLTLTRASKEFCNLLGLTSKVIGCKFEEIVEPRYASWVYQVFDHLRDANSVIKDMCEIKRSIWSCTLSYEKPSLTITLSPIWEVENVNLTQNMGNVVNLPLNRFLGCFYDSILLRYVDDQFLIESLGISLSEKTGLIVGDPINKLFPSLRSICSDILLRRCIEKRKPVYFLDIFTGETQRYYLLIALVPLNHYQPYLLAGIHLLTEKEYFSMMKSVNKSSDKICESDNIGVAVVEVCNGKFHKIINSNLCFDRLVYSGEEYTHLFNKLVPICCAQHNIVTIPYRLGNVDSFITAIPTLNAKQLFVFIFPDMETKQSLQKLANRLTKREFEISSRIFSGDSIRSIAIDCGISEGTVKKNLSNIYNKLQVNNRVELVRLIYSCND